MMKAIVMTATGFMLACAPAVRAADGSGQPYEEAVQLAAMADAYFRYCEKDSALAGQVIGRVAADVPGTGREALAARAEEITAAALAALKEQDTACDTLAFRMEQYQLMHQLKNRLRVLNGKEPEEDPMEMIDEGEGNPL